MPATRTLPHPTGPASALSSPRLLAQLLLPLSLALAAVPARAQEQCHYLRLGEIPIRYVGEPLMPAIDGSLNGAAAVMLVSSGMFANMLTLESATARQLKVRDSGRLVIGDGGRTRLFTARLNDMSAGAAHTGETSIGVINRGAHQPYDGMMGASFLFQADLELNLPQKRLTFFRPKPGTCDKSFLGYWARNVVEIPTFGRGGDNPRFRVELNGVKLDAVISTGDSHTSVTIDAARLAGFKTDGPGVTRAKDVNAIGWRAVESWNATFDTLRIGDETINHPVINVIDSHGSEDIELTLGADFLRSHRVLFATSQNKIYFSYVGGEPLGTRAGDLALLQSEANGGNPDAEFSLSQAYLRAGGPGQQAAGDAWLRKAAAHGHPSAQMLIGRGLLANGRYAEAADLMRKLLQRQPNDPYAALSLYVAGVGLGAQESARQALEQRFPVQDLKGKLAALIDDSTEPSWPRLVADFYLGRIDAEQVFAQAARDESEAKGRMCEAYRMVGTWYQARSDAAGLEALRTRSSRDGNTACVAGAAPPTEKL